MGGHSISGGVRFSSRAKIVVLLTVAGLLLLLLLRAQSVLGPFVWGAIAAYIFTPVVDFLETRARLPRILVVALLYLAGLGVAAWASIAFIPLVVKQAGDLLSDMPGILMGLFGSLDFLSQHLQAERLEPFDLALDPQVLVNEAVRGMQSLFTYLTRQAIPAVFNVLEGLGQVILSLIIAFYLLRSARTIRARLERLIPRPYRGEALDLLLHIDRVVGAYIRGQLLLVGLMAVAIVIALSILRVRYALVIGLFSGLLSIIPLFGPVAGGAIAASVALFQPTTPFGWSNLTLALAVVVVYIVLRQTENHLVVPNLMGPIVDLHPLLVLFGLFAGGKIAGFTGLVIAVPTAAALKIIAIYLYGKIWEEASADEPAAGTSPAALPGPPSAPSGEIP